MELASSQELVRSATSSVETIESELARLKALVVGLRHIPEAPSLDEVKPCQPEPLVRSAFNFEQPSADRCITQHKPTLPDPNLLEEIAKTRCSRIKHFGAGLFADPAWDMIIDLAAAHARFKRVTVTSLCIASGVPSTTALRWIGILVEQGFFQREHDSIDKRRVYISLTDKALSKVARYFSSFPSSNVPGI